MKNSNDTSWDRTSDLPICSTHRGPPERHVAAIVNNNVQQIGNKYCTKVFLYLK